LGETYELEGDDFRFFAEQVSHHPPVSACFAQGKKKDWEYFMNTNMKTQFWGASLEIIHLALSHIQLRNFQEEYVI